MILVIMLYSLFAVSFTIAKILLNFLPPVLLIGVRMSLAGIVLLVMHQFSGKSWPKITIRQIPWWLFFGAVHIMMPYVTEFIALQTVAPSCSALIYNLSPFFAALFSYIYFREIMTFQKWIGLMIGFGSIVWFVHGQDLVCVNVSGAYLLLLISVIFGSWGWIFVRKLMLQGYAPLFVNGMAMLIGGMQSLIIAYFFEPVAIFDWDTLPQFSFWLFLIILITNVIYYNAYSYLLKRYTATLLSFMGCIVPLMTSLFDWLLLDIQVSSTFFITLIFASFGVYLFYQEELRQGYIISK